MTLIDIYNKLCVPSDSWRNPPKGYYKHRIIPGHAGGEYVDGNVALLTYKAHRLAHRILARLGSKADQFAYNMLAGNTEVARKIAIQLSVENRRKTNFAALRDMTAKRDTSASAKKGWSKLTKEQRSERNKKAAAKVDHHAKNVKRGQTIRQRKSML